MDSIYIQLEDLMRYVAVMDTDTQQHFRARYLNNINEKIDEYIPNMPDSARKLAYIDSMIKIAQTEVGLNHMVTAYGPPKEKGLPQGTISMVTVALRRIIGM
jgi:hypothetical protein